MWKINKRYGATFKLLKVAVEPHTKQKLDLSHIDFIDYNPIDHIHGFLYLPYDAIMILLIVLSILPYQDIH